MAKSLTEKDPQNNRIHWVDNAKAILIILVVAGHFKELPVNIRIFIYEFHIPAFLFITGFNFKDIQSISTFGEFFKKYTFRFSAIYFIFSAIAFMIWAIVNIKSINTYSALAAIWQIIYGTQSVGNWFIHQNTPLWYLPFLASSLTAFYFTMKLNVPIRTAVVAALVIFSAVYDGPRLPWSADAAGIGIFFIAFGYWLRRYLSTNSQYDPATYPTPMVLITAIAGFAIVFAISSVNGDVNINVLHFGDNFLYYIFSATLGVYSITMISYLIPNNTIMTMLSKESLIIFCLHMYGVIALNKLTTTHGEPVKIFLIVAFAIILSIFAAFVSRIISPWLERIIRV